MKIYSVLIFIILSSCATGKIAIKTGIEEIRFGSGGGFTGEVKTYVLTSNNTLLEMEKELKKVDLKKTMELFKEAKGFINYTFNEPENIYSFIEIKTKEKTNIIVWSFGSLKVDKRITELHKKLMILKN